MFHETIVFNEPHLVQNQTDKLGRMLHYLATKHSLFLQLGIL